MSDEWKVTTKENFPTVSTLVVNNTDLIAITDVINYGLALFVAIQIGYTVWKWRRDYVLHRERKEDSVDEC